MKWSAALGLFALAHGQTVDFKGIIEELEKMADTNKEEQEADKTSFAELSCWYNNEKEKMDERIAKNKEDIPLFDAKIQKQLAENGETSQKLAEVAAELEAIEEANQKAEAMHAKETEEYETAKADMEAALGQMEEAINLLAAVGADQTANNDGGNQAFMNEAKKPVGVLLASNPGVAKKIRLALDDATALASGAAKRQLVSLIQESAPGSVPYSSASTKIIGILKNMKDTFELNLKEATETYEAAKVAHEAFMANQAKAQEAAEKSQARNNDVLAEGIMNLDNLKQRKKDAAIELANDEEALRVSTEIFEAREAMYQKQKKLRAGELKAISHAITILNDPSSYDTFKAIDGKATVFLQTRAIRKSFLANKQRVQRRNMIKNLFNAARKTKSSALSQLAATVLEGNMPFATLFAEIDKMKVRIEEEKEMDAKKDADCTDLKEHTDSSIADAEAELEAAHNRVAEYTAEKEEEQANVDDATIALADAKAERKELSEERTKDHKLYQVQSRDSNKGIGLLKQATMVLKQFFDKMAAEDTEHTEAATQQLDMATTGSGGISQVAPEARDYDNAGRGEAGASVIGLLTDLKTKYEDDLHAMFESEAASQDGFNVSYEDLSMTMASKEESIRTSESRIADLDEDIAAEEGVGGTIPTQETIKANLEKAWAAEEEGCEWIWKYISDRKVDQDAQLAALDKVVADLKATPVHMNAEAEARDLKMGACLKKCPAALEKEAECQACLAKTSVKQFCTANPSTPGCV